MDIAQKIKNLSVPSYPIDVVLDTDTFNETDDQFALSYLLASKDKLHLRALYAAPFFNSNSVSPADGMNKSYDEILRILKLAGHEELSSSTFHGSDRYLPDEKTPVISDAAKDLAQRAAQYTAEKPLYVVAIAAITNIASALLLDPSIAEKIVVVWLGGHAQHMPKTDEFNMMQDIAAARVVFDSGAPLVQLPCNGVVTGFSVSYLELNDLLRGKNPLCDFLVDRVKEAMDDDADCKPRTRVIWDVTAVAWLLNEDNRFMDSALIPTLIPEYDFRYAVDLRRPPMRYVYEIHRDELAIDLFDKLAHFFE